MGYMISSFKQAKRAIVIVFGFTILGIGILMIVLPGPALLVIPFSLAILGTEFIWARRLLRRYKFEIFFYKKKVVQYFKSWFKK